MRVVLISRRFWPLTGGAERATANLACGLSAAGACPSVVTARFDAQWPGQVSWREMPVHRLPFPQRFAWGMTRYMIALSRWLRQHRSVIDVVCVSRLAQEAHAAVGALAGTSVPVVLRAEAAHAPDEVTGKCGSRFGRRLGRYQQADAIVAASAEARHRLLAAGFDPGQVHSIPNGIACQGQRTADRRHTARSILAAANEDLRVPLNVPVALCIGQLTADNAFDQVVRAWPQVARRWPFARLWIIGDGEERENLYRQIRHADLIGRVLLPGAFDEVDDLLQAADLIVLPASSGKEPIALLEALAAELPVLASHSPGHQELVVHGLTGRLYPAGNVDQLASAILDAFDDQDAGKWMAAAARQRLSVNRDISDSVQSHLSLFEQLIASRARALP